MNDDETGTITISTGELHQLLRNVRHGAGKDGTLPMLVGVLLHTDRHPRLGDVLVATATNRYVLVQGYAPVSGVLPGRVFLTSDQVKQVLRVTRPYRKAYTTAMTRLAVSDAQVLVTQPAAPELDLGDSALALTTTQVGLAGNFPGIGKIIEKPMETGPVAEAVSVAPQMLSLLARLADSISGSMGAAVRLTMTGVGQPVLAQIGDRLSALVMPVQQSDDRPPVFLDVPPAAGKTLAGASA